MRTIAWMILGFILLTSCATKIDSNHVEGRSLVINNRKIYVEEYGRGTPLIILSGGGLRRSTKDFEKCIPSLSEHFRVILPDTPGQGRSEQTDSLSYDLLTGFMSQLIDSLQVDSCYVMGLSDGGIVSLLLAERRSDKVKRVIAVGANNGTRGFTIPEGFSLDSVKMPSVDEWAVYHKEDIDEWAVYHKEDIEWYNALEPKKDWRKMANNLNSMWYAREYFPRNVYDHITIPVMIVLGDRDDISIDHGQEMYQHIKGSQLCILPNTTHEVFAEQPEIITKIAMNFFK